MNNSVLWLWAAALIFIATLAWTTIDSVTMTVNGKERIASEKGGYFLVYTDKGTFKNEDSILNLKWNSGDLQGKLTNGETFTCDKNFWRIPLFSRYENLLTCEKQ